MSLPDGTLLFLVEDERGLRCEAVPWAAGHRQDPEADWEHALNALRARLRHGQAPVPKRIARLGRQESTGHGDLRLRISDGLAALFGTLSPPAQDLLPRLVNGTAPEMIQATLGSAETVRAAQDELTRGLQDHRLHCWRGADFRN